MIAQRRPKPRPEPRPWRWRPSALVALSLGFHLVGVVAMAIAPRLWPWVVGGMAVDQLGLAVIGSLPRSRGLGPNLTRLPKARADTGAVALTFDDGPDPEITPRVLNLLERHDAKATFFCVGQRARRYPEVVRAIAAAGHAVANHTDSHRYAFGFFGPRTIGREIDRAQETLSELTGDCLPFFRPPAGIRSPLLDPVLAGRGMRLVSWTRRGFDAVTRDADRVYRRLVRDLAAGDILLLHDGAFGSAVGSPRTEPTHPTRPVLEVLQRLLNRLDELGLHSVALAAEDADDGDS